MLSHTNLVMSSLGMMATAQLMTSGGRCLFAAPLFHIAGFAVWVALGLVGGTHVILPGFAAHSVLAAVELHRITDTLLVPTMLQMVVDHPAVGDYDLSSLRTLIYGASPISEALLDRAQALLPGVRFIQGYGMTELASAVTLLLPEDHGPEGRASGRLRSAGRPAAHAEVRVVDDNDIELPRGAVGEIAVRGRSVMLGSWRRQSETAVALRGGWMHTGDGGYMDHAGYVYIVDRMKDMIVSGGENVYSAEVENALHRHPAVAASAVIGVPDPNWGERVHAVVVLQPGVSASADELRAHCKQFIAGYKAPRSVEFVEALPLSAAGKVLKHELRRPYWEGCGRAVG
jgi:acyl-CoA synthetase (AMP-forming)/AMP-acid ligase II